MKDIPFVLDNETKRQAELARCFIDNMNRLGYDNVVKSRACWHQMMAETIRQGKGH